VDEKNFPDQFDRLEAKIEQLVRTCEELQDAKAVLENKVGELEMALMEKGETEQSYREEKTVIRSKVDGLLGRLDKVLAST